MDILVRLYWSFVKIGFSSFGGMSMIPQISAEMLSNGWMNAAQVNDIVAIAEMTPGPLGFNCATFAGIQAAGIPGALAANLGAATPALTLGMLAAACFQKFKSSSFLQRAMVGIRRSVRQWCWACWSACFARITGSRTGSTRQLRQSACSTWC